MPRKHRVVVTDFITDALEPERKILGELADVEALGAFNEAELRGRIEDADAILMYHNLAITAETISRLTACKLIVRCGVGFDNVDRLAARQRGIPVANIPDYGSEEVADTAIGFTLALARGIAYQNSRLRAGEGPWSYEQVVPLYRLRGRVFAIVGLGRIGSAAALRAKALGMDVAFYDPYKPDGYDRSLGIRRVEALPELLAQAYVLSLHCPLSEETRRLIHRESLALMPHGSYLVNTSRGAVVDAAAVVEAIESGKLAGAGIDVLEHEPPDDRNPLVKAWRDPAHPAHHRVLINPHSAFYCEQGLLDMRVKGAEACRRALTGQPLRNVVN
jgi:D-3-phosphoglycerate dehydrogenase/C-terminal binding protein